MLFHATALGKAWPGTRFGIKDPRAAQLKVRAQAVAKSKANIHSTGARPTETATSPSDPNTEKSCVTMSTFLREYRSALPPGSSAIEGEYLNIELMVFKGEGVLLPDDVLLSAQGKTWVLIYTDGKVEKVPVTIEQRGIEGVTVKEDLAGRTLLLAKPDILLRASSGVPVIIHATITQS